MEEQSASLRMMELGRQMARGFDKGMYVAKKLDEIYHVNNNWRKMHGQPMHHRNRPSMKRAEFWKCQEWERDHGEGE